MFQPLTPVQANPYVGHLSIGAGRRLLAIGLALLIQLLLLILLLGWGPQKPPNKKPLQVNTMALEVPPPPENAPVPKAAAPQQAEQKTTSPRPEAAEPTEPTVPAELLTPQAPPPIPASPVPQPNVQPPSAAPARPSGGTVYGPPDKRSGASRDTERVGTAPNGEPMYAAAWYREPRDDELRGYLATASGPGWGLIACRTAPNFRVEDCVALDEYPQGSQINRAILAAAWAFQVRPPRVGGRSLVGSWVRIRIDYTQSRR